MPERSNIKPIKVKKGIASKVSFCMMPKMRSGRLCKKAGWMTPNSTATKPKNKPQAASEKVTA